MRCCSVYAQKLQSTAMKYFILFALVAAEYVALIEGYEIILGYECGKHSVPYQVSLNAGYHFCGGSLISTTWVLSAAQCYKSSIQVRLGEHNIAISEGTEQFINSAKVIRHPNYNSHTMEHDLMLIKLSTPAVLNSYVSIVGLSTFAGSLGIPGGNCLISGWGNTRPSSSFYPDRLMCLKALRDINMSCEREYPELYIGDDNLFCVGHLGGINDDSCRALTGGPVLCNGELQGILTQAPGCHGSSKQGLVTNIFHDSTWIHDTMSRY